MERYESVANNDVPAALEEVLVGSRRYDMPASVPRTATERSNRSSFSVDARERPLLAVVSVSNRGFRPLSRTFLRALIPTQLTSCLKASRSDTVRRCAVRGTVPGTVPKGVPRLGRMGVMKRWGVASTLADLLPKGVKGMRGASGVLNWVGLAFGL